jgi:hypothetical protein
MAVENDFLPFAVGTGANVIAQVDYVADTADLQDGFQAGIASSAKMNKVWRQSSIMAAVLAQFIVDSTSQPAIDDGTTATLLANLTMAVKQGKGSFQNIIGFTVSTTLTAADAGCLIADRTAGAPSTYTLPAAGTMPSGSAISFLTINGSGCVVQRAGGDVINVGGQTGNVTVLSISLKVGDTLTLISNGLNGWYVQGGSAALPFSGQFAYSFGAAGYQKLPSGLIMQWLNGISAATGIMTQAWPITFPNAVLSANSTYLSAGTALATNIATMSTNTTNSTCVVNVVSSAGAAVASANIKVIAVGW